MRSSVVAFVVGALIVSGSLLAFGGPSVVVANAEHSAATAVGPSFLKSYTVSCGTSATSMAPSGFGSSLIAVQCIPPEGAETGATTRVAIGDSTIADPAFATRNSPSICGSGCVKNTWEGNAKQAYCRVGTGSVTLFCAALVPTLTAP
jgi:hypothetical protein